MKHEIVTRSALHRKRRAADPGAPCGRLDCVVNEALSSGSFVNGCHVQGPELLDESSVYPPGLLANVNHSSSLLPSMSRLMFFSAAFKCSRMAFSAPLASPAVIARR